jgi:hypothetical protein
LPDFKRVHTEDWRAHFISRGYPGVAPLGSGVEGAIYRLGNGTVAKVWARRHGPELLRLQDFYADVGRVGLPFATPVILGVEEVDGVAVTFELELPGAPLQKRMALDDARVGPAALACVVEVLRALAAVPATAAMQAMPVLDEGRPFWAGADDFRTALAALLERRVGSYHTVLRRDVPDFDRRYELILETLAALDPHPTTVIHGDLFGENILVDERLRPVAVLDFGFLSTAGDPRLDAAITSGIMNMYGPHANEITAAVTRALAAELGYSRDVMLVYRAAYALATGNAFTPDGNDGHYSWCVAQLANSDLSAVLDI